MYIDNKYSDGEELALIFEPTELSNSVRIVLGKWEHGEYSDKGDPRSQFLQELAGAISKLK